MKKTKVYRIKKLIDGSKIGLVGQYVAVPDRNYKDARIIVDYLGVRMTIPDWHKAEEFRRFHDIHGRQLLYTLGYFKFVADPKPEYVFGSDGIARLKTGGG